MMKNFKTIENLLAYFRNEAKTEKAGKWQATTDYEDEEMMVLRNITLTVPPFKNAADLRDATNADQPWSEMHFLERINGIPSNPGETYKIWPYANFDKDHRFKGDKFSHTYQERFWPKNAGEFKTIRQVQRDPAKYSGYSTNKGLRFELGDLVDVIDNLISNNLTRQAYLPIWFPEDTWAANNNQRVPCTLGYYFWIEEGKLYMNYTIRSCDLFRHFRNDIYLTQRLLQHVAKKTNTEVGYLTMIIYNLHLFKNDKYAFDKKELKIRISSGKNN